MQGVNGGFMQLQTFSTDGTPRSERDRFFQQEMLRRFSVGLSIKPSGDLPLNVEVMAYCGRRLGFASLKLSAHRACSAMSLTGTSTPLLITLQKEGTACVSQSGRENRIEAGQMFMLDPTRPFTIETTNIHTHSVYLQAECVRAVLPHLDELTARPIESKGGAGSLLATMLDEMFRIAPNLDERTADALADALPYVLATAFSAVDDGSVETSTRVKLLHKRRIQQFVREHLRDHALDPNMIADGVHLSLRRVYELCGSDVPPMKWIWAERLERCRRDLGAHPLMARPIGAIAYSWGFSDLSHFSHAFRHRFGMSPRTWRKQALGEAACRGIEVREDSALTAGDRPRTRGGTPDRSLGKHARP